MRDDHTDRLVEIACDESGSEGEKLIGGNTGVFAHASVHLPMESAAACIREARDRIRSPAEEYKATHFLREKHRPVLKWLLAPAGPIHGNASVYLTDKKFFVITKLVDLLDEEPEPALDMAATLYGGGESAFGRDRWNTFLQSFNDLIRAKTSADSFFALADTLRTETDGLPAKIMDSLFEARPQITSYLSRIHEPPRTPILDPLIPAITQAVRRWGQGGKLISIVHDEQTALTKDRISQLRTLFDHPPRPSGTRLISLRLADSRLDTRIQVADFLAGIARKITSNEIANQGDQELTELLKPYIDASSIWGDTRTRPLLGLPATRPRP
ncbi:DUF3800 domain-containing protein [Acrocarpospora sp. B8E8]|uniref:DUF3800 domain-containing protein n=1 Tax=Acrocarpospora sp. B8E8 TaxID=3153572 RepID=UPI00325CB1CC